MMIVMKEGATEEQVAAVIKRVEAVGAHAHVSTGELVTVIGAIGDREHVANLGLEGAPGVDHLVPILKPYKLASLQYRREQRTVLEIEGRRIGGEHFATIAGPCTVESREVLLDAARTVKEAGGPVLRGGARQTRAAPDRGRPRRQAGAAEARSVGDARGAPDGGGVRPEGGQRAGDALRARHPHLRAELPLHARPDGRARAARADAPADRDRPEPRGWQALAGGAAV